MLSTRVGRAEWVPLRMAYCRLAQGGALRRPLTAAVAAAGRGRFVLDGVARMRERPIQDLVDGLVQLGVQASCSLGTGCPPVEVLAEGLPSGTVRRCSLPSSVTTAAGWSHFTPACLGSCHMQPASLLCPAPIMRSCLALMSMHDTVHSWAASWGARCSACCTKLTGTATKLSSIVRDAGGAERLGEQPVPDSAAHGCSARHRRDRSRHPHHRRAGLPAVRGHDCAPHGALWREGGCLPLLFKAQAHLLAVCSCKQQTLAQVKLGMHAFLA